MDFDKASEILSGVDLPSSKTLGDLISVELGNDGRVYVTVDSSVVIRVTGDEYYEVGGSSVRVTGEDGIVLTGRHHHVNPGGGKFFDERMSRACPSSSVRDLMVSRGLQYESSRSVMARRAFYIEAARRNLNKRRKRSCECRK